jgi:hypothetical protein
MKEEFFKTSMIRKRHAKLSFLSVAQWVELLFELFFHSPAYARDIHEIGKLSYKLKKRVKSTCQKHAKRVGISKVWFFFLLESKQR